MSWPTATSGRFGFPHEGHQPHRREIADDEYRIAGAGADELTRADLALHDRPADRGIDRGVGADLPGLLKCRDLLFRTAEDSQPVMGCFQRRFGRAHVILRRRQIGSGTAASPSAEPPCRRRDHWPASRRSAPD